MQTHVALVAETDLIATREVMQVSAALQKQVSRDFAPIWGIPSTVDAFETLEDVPTGYWPVIVRDDIGVGAAGIHLDDDGQPFGLVSANNRWTLTASHEILEMLADPQGNNLRAARSIHPDQVRVEYLVEVCDPSEAWTFGYDVNGIRVSDFYTPDFFLPVHPGNVRYSFTGAIEQPLQVLEGGYISWLNPETGDWWQQIWFSGPHPAFRNLGPLEASGISFRTQIDQHTLKNRESPEVLTGIPEDDDRIKNQRNLQSSYQKSTDSKSAKWRRQIEALKSGRSG